MGGIGRLAVWLVRAGVRPERIAPGRPQQNGRHERLHLTVQQDTVLPVARDRREQQRRFAAFTRMFNEERPHEALDMATPSKVWSPEPASVGRRAARAGVSGRMGGAGGQEQRRGSLGRGDGVPERDAGRRDGRLRADRARRRVGGALWSDASGGDRRQEK
ncbi:MAG: transposase [Rhodospirillales bacterium]|nr:MAG: transposase [Rhodospirillales bacterium]